MDFTPDPIQTLLLWRLLADDGGAFQNGLKPNLAKPKRDPLVKAGLLHRHDLGDHVWRFELGEDPCAPSVHDEMGHPHFMCVECGDVTCLPGVLLSLPAKGGAPARRESQALWRRGGGRLRRL